MNDRAVTLDRAEVAAMLRAARLHPSEQSRLLDWVLLARPESRPAQRMKIACLLDEHDYSAADAMLARALLLSPCDPTFMLLRAKSLIAQQRPADARAELSRVTMCRPHWRRAALLAAELAEVMCDFPRAAQFYAGLSAQEPENVELRERLIAMLIESGDIEQAEELLDALIAPSPLLVSQLRRRQGRVRDALDALEPVRRRMERGEKYAAGETRALLELLEELGDIRSAQRLLGSLGSSDAAAQLHQGLLLLRQGRFAQAARLMARLRTDPVVADDALRTLAVAAALSGRPRLSKRALHRVRTQDREHVREMIERWRRGLVGRVIRNQRSAKTACADPASSLLRPLIAAALESFDAIARGEIAPQAAVDPAELRKHRAACLDALGG